MKTCQNGRKMGRHAFCTCICQKKVVLRTSACLRHSPVATFASCRTYANERFFASRVVPLLRIIDSLRSRRISRYPHGPKAIDYREISFRQAKNRRKICVCAIFVVPLHPIVHIWTEKINTWGKNKDKHTREEK